MNVKQTLWRLVIWGGVGILLGELLFRPLGVPMNLTEFGVVFRSVKASATLVVQRHAAIYAPDVPQAEVAVICNALGEISIDEATAALDRLQRETYERDPHVAADRQKLGSEEWER